MNSEEPEGPIDAEDTLGKNQPEPLDKTVIGSGDTVPMSDNAALQAPEDWVGRHLGKYHIVDLLGVGGMGVVLKAHDSAIERDVAIKVLPPDLAADEVALTRFLAEAKSAGRLHHPNAVTIYDVAQHGQTHFLVMEIVSGGSALDHLELDGAYSVAEATRITIEASRGLAAAHEKGLVHRDVKPANLLLAADKTVKVSDFGLAKRTHETTLQMTQTGQVIGTPYFMSPEQCEAKSADVRSDIYSLGATYYSLLTGKKPYQDSGSVMQIMYAHCNSPPPDPRDVRADIPTACAHIIERAMATHPDDRYQTMDEFRADLEAVAAAISGAGIDLPSQSKTSWPRPPAAPKQTSRRTIIASAVAVAIVTAAVLIGIGIGSGGNNSADKDGGDAKDNSGSPAPVVPPTGEPIRIGILHSLSGTMSDSESPVADAALLAIDELNHAGGVLGRPVEPVVADGRSDPTVFAREAERLIKEDKVCTVFGCWTSSSRKTVVPIFEQLDHLLIYPVQYEGVEESPNVIYTGATPSQQIIPAVKWAYDSQNKRRFFLVGSDYVFPRVAHEIIKDQLQLLGAELAGEAFLPLGSTDVAAAIQAIQQAKPDVILNSINGDSNTPFFAALRKAGITPETVPTISFSIGEEELRHLSAATTGDYAAWNYFQSIDSPENHVFVAAFRKKYGPQRVVTDPMEAAYFGVKLWAKAVAAAESTEPPVIRRAMRNQRMRAPEGEVRIDPATQHTFKTPRIGRVRDDGQFDVVWTAPGPEPPQPYPQTRTTEQWRAYLHDLYTAWGNQWTAPSP